MRRSGLQHLNWTERTGPLRPAFCCVLLILAACTGGGTETSIQTASSARPDRDGEVTNATATPVLRDDLKIVDRLPPPPETNDGADELIAENDVLEIDVFQVDELDRDVKVDSRGRVSLALIGSVDAKGKTIPQLEEEVEGLYGAKYLQNPEITIFMKESAGQRITIDGSVRKPGIYPVSSTSTLLQIIALAGGFGETADESKLYVYRDFGGRKLVANYDVKNIRSGKLGDPRIYGGDVIVSFQSGAKVAAKNLREALGIASRAVAVAAPF